MTHIICDFFSEGWRSESFLEVSSFQFSQNYLLYKCENFESYRIAYCIELWMFTCGSEVCISIMISRFEYNCPPIRIPCSTMTLYLFFRWCQLIFIETFYIAVGRFFSMVWYEKYFALLLVAVIYCYHWLGWRSMEESSMFLYLDILVWWYMTLGDILHPLEE